jgi:hypothetical protein
MPIELAPADRDTEDLFKEEGDGTEYNMKELMDQVYELKDVIFTVPADQVDILKKGLITRKGKDNARLKDAGVSVDQSVLSFLVYPHKGNDGKEIEGVSDVRVKLGPKKSVSILAINIPDDL